MEDKYATAQNSLEFEREKNAELEHEIERLKEDIAELRFVKGGDENAISRIQSQLDDKKVVIEELKEQCEYVFFLILGNSPS